MTIRLIVAGMVLALFTVLSTPASAQTVPTVHVASLNGTYSRSTGVLSWTTCTVDQAGVPVSGVAFNGGIVLNVKGVAFNSSWPAGLTGTNGCLSLSLPVGAQPGEVVCNPCGLVLYGIVPPLGYVADGTSLRASVKLIP